MTERRRRVKNRWRLYTTAAGASPVRDFIRSLPREHAAEIRADMNVVRVQGLEAARHLAGDVYEVRTSVDGQQYRVLFALEGIGGRVLLAVEAFQKKTQRTPPRTIELAQKRLAEWRRRGAGR